LFVIELLTQVTEHQNFSDNGASKGFQECSQNNYMLSSFNYAEQNSINCHGSCFLLVDYRSEVVS
jgi:hypothetical protein